MTPDPISSLYPNLSTLLLAIQKRPMMFLNSKSVIALSIFISGIQFAEAFHAIEPSKKFCDFDFIAFEQWVDQSFNPDSIALDSFELASYLAGADDGGFDQWFTWYKTFLNTRK